LMFRLSSSSSHVCLSLEEENRVCLTTVGQFHQRYTSSFYARRSQNCKKDCQVNQLFALSESAYTKKQ
jgi:hypothetical protein